MLMTVFVVGLNAPSLPLLPLFTCAAQTIGSKTATKIGPNAENRFVFIQLPLWFDQLPVAAVA
jgi:hypothetical protein